MIGKVDALKSLHSDRLAENRDNPREVAFAAQWQYEHEYADKLGNLFAVYTTKDDPEGHKSLFDPFGSHIKFPLGVPTERDRIVAATVVQWLGSNCGMSFIYETMKRCGGRLMYPGECKP